MAAVAKLYLLSLLLIMAGCEELAKEAASSGNASSSLVSKNTEARNLIEDAFSKYGPEASESGAIGDLPGFVYQLPAVAAGETTVLAFEQLDRLAEQDIFTYAAPSGREPRYAAPLLLSEANKGLSSEKLCQALAYTASIPKFKDLDKKAGTYVFCIELQLQTQVSVYFASPSLQIQAELGSQSTVGGAQMTIDGNAGYTAASSVTLSLVAEGATEMYITNSAACLSGGHWEAFTGTKSWSLADTNKRVSVYAKFRDAAGGESVCLEASIMHDSLPPALASVAINEGQEYTPATQVSLSLSASDAAEMFITNIADCSSGGVWEAYQAQKTWTLGTSNASVAVYAKFKDEAGNETACMGDSIIHSSFGPSSVSFSINAGDSHSTTSTVTLDLQAVGADAMYISETAGCSTAGTWESYASSKVWALGQTNATATIYAKFKDSAGVETACLSDTIIHDDQGPSATSVSINAGAAYTTNAVVNLVLAATDASTMFISNSSDCASGGNWEAFATSKSWTLGHTNASTNVYVKFKDDAGNETSCLSDAITHDDVAPSAVSLSIAGGASYATTSIVSLTLAASAASEMYLSNTAGCASGGTWETYATSKAWTLGQSNTTAVVYVKFRDAADNESTCISDSVIHDDQGPSATSISIDAGAVYATSTSVTLTLAASDASVMYITNTAGCASNGSWETYAASKAWTLGQTNAAATVYVKFRDVAGSESSCLDDAITHDSQAPSAGSISINSGASHTKLTSATLTLSATGASEMYITDTAGCGSDGSWETYATSKSWTLPQANASNRVNVKYRDGAGNTSSCYYADIIHDNQAPTSGSVSIGSAAAYTSSTSVSLTLAATGASDMYVTNTAGCASDGTWEAYATTKSPWTLGQTNSTATVYVIFTDEAGNNSNCVSDTIVHDSVVPSTPSSFSDGASALNKTTSPLMSWGASTDSGSGLSAYQIAIGTTAGGTETLDWTSVGNVTSASLNSLTLVTDTTYYGSIRAMDAAGNVSTVSQGNGFLMGWYQEAYLKAGNAEANDGFGTSVAIDGDTLVVGALREASDDTTITNGTAPSTDNDRAGAGAAYVYTRVSGSWSQQAFLKASNAFLHDNFGISVSVSGDTIVVGARGDDRDQTTITNGTSSDNDDNNEGDSGAAYVYKRSGSTWIQEAYIKTPNSELGDQFAHSLALSGDTLAVVARSEDSNEVTVTNGTTAPADNSVAESGAVYIFQRSAAVWSQQAYIKAANAKTNDYFGDRGLQLDGDTLVVSHALDDSNETAITNGTTASTDTTVAQSGAAFVYKRTGTTWQQQAYIKAVNAEADDGFGHAVGVSGDTVAVGARWEDSSQTTITNGTSAPTDNWTTKLGAVYVYQRAGSSWAQQAYLKSSRNKQSTELGTGLAISGNYIAAGTPYDVAGQTTITQGVSAASDDAGAHIGAVYMFKRSASSWAHDAFIKPYAPVHGNSWSNVLAMSGTTLAVAVPEEDSSQTTITNGPTASTNTSAGSAGAVYIYRK